MSQINLLHFGPLLGFPVNTTIQANRTWTNSPSTVDINLGLRYITVSCACVDSDRNFDTTGKRSKVIATIPVTSEQSLNSSVTFYDSIHSVVSVLNGDHNMFEFDFNTNIGNKVDLSVMCELYVEYWAGVKRHLLRPLRGLPVRGKIIPEGKGIGLRHK